jgi:HEAT repeat protein
MQRIARALIVACLCAAAAPSARSDDPPAPPPAQPPKADDPAAAQKKKRIELDERRAKLPDSAKKAMQLLDRFRDRDFRVWSTSRGQIVAEGANAVPALLISLEELDWETRAFAAGCLADIKAETAAGALADAYDRETFTEAKRQYVIAMATIQSPASKPALLKAAAAEDDGLRVAAARGLAAYEDPQLKEALGKLATDANPDVKYEARGGLAALNDAATVKSLVDEAKAMVKDRDVERVASKEIQDNGDRYAQYLLGLALARADEQKEVFNLLTEIVTAEKPWEHKSFLRMGAAEGLGRRSALKGKVDPRLASGITHRDDVVRVACSYAAGWVGSPELLPKLKEALSDAQMDVRYNAARALGRIGTSESAKLLERALLDKAAEVRVGAVRALGINRTPEATKALLTAIKDEKYVIRVIAARNLAHRTAEEGVLEALQKAARDRDYGVREQALAALAHHSDGAAVLAVIARGLEDPDFGVRTNACLGLAAIGPAALAAEAPVGQAVATMYLAAKEPRLVRGADEALDAVRFPSAVPVLLDGLGADSEEARRRANLALSKMGETGVGYDPAAPKDQREVMAKKWREWWAAQGGKLPPRGARAHNTVTGSLAETAKDLKWKGIDIALCFDSTGSMEGLINAAKERIDEIADELHDLLPSLRVSVYTYRDFGSDYLYYGTPLTYDTWKLPAFLQDATAGQGGDLPEAVYECVSNCCDKLLWRPDAHKVVVYAGDASHHPESTNAFLDCIKKFFTEKNQAVLHAIYTATGRRSLDVAARQKREEWGKVKSTVFDLFKLTAETGRGRAIPLEDESALIKELLVLTFGEAFRADVENLLDFER